MRRLWRKRQKLNNKGSAIVTVIVVVLFITILATTLLFVSGRSYIMKQTDYQNKVSFYAAEETLDKLKELLIQDVNKAFDVAYRDAMIHYASMSKAELEAYYVKAFNAELDRMWKEEPDRTSANPAATALDKVKQFMVSKGVSSDMTKLIKNVYALKIVPIEDDNRFVIKGIEVYYVDEKGFSSYIKTDIVIMPPDCGFGSSDSDEGGGETETSSEEETETSSEEDTIDMNKCVIYANWQKY